MVILLTWDAGVAVSNGVEVAYRDRMVVGSPAVCDRIVVNSLVKMFRENSPQFTDHWLSVELRK